MTAARRILLVGLEPRVARPLRERLDDRGRVVESAASGTEMIEFYCTLLRQQHRAAPDLLVVDLDVAGMIQDLIVMRIVAWDVAILALAEEDARHLWRDAFRLGVIDVLAKPVEPRALCDRIHNLATAAAG